MRKNNKGITLIALIVTIIILIIIAGISIASLTSDNGILRQTNAAKVEQIQGTAREQVKLAISAMRLAIAEASAQDNSYKANENAGLIQAKLKEILNEDKEGLNGTFDFGGSDLADDASATEITISYTGDDYKNACNDENAQIAYSIGLGQRTIELTREATPGMTGSDGTNVDINISDSNYLVDNVEIGDYVDINIDYTNVYNASYPYQNITEVNYSSTNGPTGWRVLSKSGKGATGYVTIISAGTPLTYYHKYGESEISKENLANLNTTLTTSEGEVTGFRQSGFTGNTMNMASVWALDKNVNASTAHAFTSEEAIATYKAITRSTETLEQLRYNADTNVEAEFRTSTMRNKYPNMSEHANDLLGVGTHYWLGGLPSGPYSLWYVYFNGSVSYSNNNEFGVRSVVSLKSGIKIAGGDGTADSAIKLAE